MISPSSKLPSHISQVCEFLFIISPDIANHHSWHRRRILRLRRPLLRHDLRESQKAQQSLDLQRRVPPTPHVLYRRALSNNQHVLARLDSKAHHALGSTRDVRVRLRIRIPDDLHFASYLRDRCIQDLLCECTGRFCYCTEHCWSAFPARRRAAL